MIGVVDTSGGAGAGAGRLERDLGMDGGRSESLFVVCDAEAELLDGGRRMRPGRTELAAVGDDGPD